jgi:hypothetical protein
MTSQQSFDRSVKPWVWGRRNANCCIMSGIWRSGDLPRPFPIRAITGFLFSAEGDRYSDLNDGCGFDYSKINLDRARVRIYGPGSREPRRKSVAAMRHRSFARAGHALRVRNEKPDLYALATCTKVRPYLTLPRNRTATKDHSDSWERFRFCARWRTGGAIS